VVKEKLNTIKKRVRKPKGAEGKGKRKCSAGKKMGEAM